MGKVKENVMVNKKANVNCRSITGGKLLIVGAPPLSSHSIVPYVVSKTQKYSMTGQQLAPNQKEAIIFNRAPWPQKVLTLIPIHPSAENKQCMASSFILLDVFF